MTRLLKPAMFIMNRLQYTYKFTLISVLFLCPILLLSYQLWEQLEQDINVTSTELEGIHLIGELNQLAIVANEYRDLMLAHNYDRTDATIQKVAQAKTRVREQLEIIGSDFKNSPLLTADQHTLLEAAWKKASNENLGSAISLQEYVASYGTLGTETEKQVSIVAKASGLVAENDSRLGAELALYLEHLRRVVTNASLLRAYANNTLNTAFVDSNTVTIIETIHADTQEALAHTQTAVTALGKDHPLTAQMKTAAEDMDTLLNRVNEQLIEAYEEKMTWQDFNADASQRLQSVFKMENTILESAQQIVEARLHLKEQRRIMLVVSQLCLLGIIAYLYLGLYASLRASIREMVDRATQVANGDMTVLVDNASHDEFAALTSNFNSMVAQMRELIRSARGSSDKTEGLAENVQQLARQNSALVSQQKDETRKITRAMEEMTAASSEVAQEAEHAANAAQDANEHAVEGQSLINSALHSFEDLTRRINDSMQVVEHLSEHSRGVTTILAVIKSIAQQTNLLALNAAIEAARAGEQGRGFAVVADEVRTLAQRSHEATVEIEGVLGKIQTGVGQAVDAMKVSVTVTRSSVETARSLGSKLDEILDGITSINDRTRSISAAALEQTESVNHVRLSVQEIDSRGGEAAAAAANTLTSIEEMRHSVEQLTGQLQRFHV